MKKSHLISELSETFAATLDASGEVVSKRTVSFLTGQLTASEAQLMICEKPFAFLQSAQNTSLAMLMGGNPFWIAQEAMEPFRQETAKNVTRLRKKS